MKHSKKISIITVFFALAFSTALSATGAGIQFSANPSILINEASVKPEVFSARAVGTIKSGRLPLAAGFGFEAGNNFSKLSYGLTGFADYYAIELQLKNTWNFYSGLGAEGSLLTSDFKNWSMSAGARFFAGINWLFYDNYLEFYIQQNVVPSYNRSLAASSKGNFMLGLPFDAGIRMHF